MFDRLPICLRTDHLRPDVTGEVVQARREQVRLADELLRTGKCRGAAFTGWLEPRKMVPPEEMARLKQTAERLRKETDVLLAIGIGGSYLGGRAVIEALAEDPECVVYAGTNISAHYLTRLRARLRGKRVAIKMVSKSGTTTEPAIAFRILKDLAAEPAAEHIIATTDARRGALRQLATREGYTTFTVPHDVGGRYSVLSAAGLMPIAYAGVDIDSLIQGASDCAQLCTNPDPLQNPAAFYAAARNLLYDQGFGIELLASFEPRLHYFAEWWKQLFGESHGKEQMGLFPASADYTTDLHSLGQYVQQGRKILFETFLVIDGGEPSLQVESSPNDLDGLNYLAGKEVAYVNRVAYEATAEAHRAGGVPNMTVLLKQLDAYSLGALIYFFEYACAVGGLMMGLNPFDQPGVEAYKTGMFELLGKPGHKERALDAGGAEHVCF
ncbi:MAG: glucose-6-phosphate isomerase [Armatimonadota bacterium]